MRQTSLGTFVASKNVGGQISGKQTVHQQALGHILPHTAGEVEAGVRAGIFARLADNPGLVQVGMQQDMLKGTKAAAENDDPFIPYQTLLTGENTRWMLLESFHGIVNTYS